MADRPISLREAAALIATADDEADPVFQILRGWASRGLVTGQKGAGRTSAVFLDRIQVCRAAILMTLRRSLGIEGEALARIGDRLDARQHSSSGPGPGGTLTVDLPTMVATVLAGQPYAFRVLMLRERRSGALIPRIIFGPPYYVDRQSGDYTSDPTYARLGCVDLDLAEIFRGIASADA